MIGNDGNKEVPHAHLFQFVYLMLFSIVWFSDSFIFGFSTFLANFIPLVLRAVLALSVLTLGFGVTSWGHWLLFNKKLPGLVTIGIFAHVRHPMYLGYILAYLGCIVGTMSLLSVIPWLFIVCFYIKIANYEEHELEKTFGKEYVGYKRKVSRWILR
jgi:protein-S-isoprenylcysteine O-methyltransferase Ste14